MFFPGYGWWRRHQGAEAKGVVTGFWGRRALGGVQLLVRYPDGSEREVRAWRHSVFGPSIGRTYPVRYDSKHPSRVVIDTAAIKAAADESLEEMEHDEFMQAKHELRGEQTNDDTLGADAAKSDPDLAQLAAEEKREKRGRSSCPRPAQAPSDTVWVRRTAWR
jgi:hypothetical protein